MTFVRAALSLVSSEFQSALILHPLFSEPGVPARRGRSPEERRREAERQAGPRRATSDPLTSSLAPPGWCTAVSVILCVNSGGYTL